MDALGAFFFVLFLLGCIGLVWLDHAAAKQERKEDEELAKQIAHLPIEKQVMLWGAHLRLRAERDLH